MAWLPDIAAVLGGAIVSFALALTGGGGSILAVPLLLYAVGLPSPHLAIGTASIAVAGSAITNLVLHARSQLVKWPCGLLFAASGVAGALLGAQLAQSIDGQRLLLAFSVLMAVVGLLMLRRRADTGGADVRLNPAVALRLVPTALGTGLAAGFFGIGAGFLVVPALAFTAGMPLRNAAATSLIAVAAFGMTTAASYAAAHLVDWPVAGLFVAGGVVGGLAGAAAARRLAQYRGATATMLAVVILAAAAYVAFRALNT